MIKTHLADKTTKLFFIPAPFSELSKEYDRTVSEVDKKYQSVAAAYKRNICAALSTLSIPFYMAQSSVYSRRFQAAKTGERIRMMVKQLDDDFPKFKTDKELEAYCERECDRIASGKVHDETLKEKDNYANQVLSELLSHSHNSDFYESSQELLLQGIVLVWASFEVFVRDFLTILLNSEISVVQRAVTSPEITKILEIKNISMEALLKHNLSIRNKFGDLVIGQKDFNSLPVIRTLFKELFPKENSLHASLKNPSLWMLFQKRHLIVHRRAVVDQKYISSTGDKVKIRAKLKVTPRQIEEHIKSSCDAVVECLNLVLEIYS